MPTVVLKAVSEAAAVGATAARLRVALTGARTGPLTTAMMTKQEGHAALVCPRATSTTRLRPSVAAAPTDGEMATTRATRQELQDHPQ
eukprot:5454089-Pyramimonas_sp.AAC.1